MFVSILLSKQDNIASDGARVSQCPQGQPSGEAFIQMDSEQSAFLAAQQRHNRYMVFGKKQRYIEVFQCSGEDMNLVLTGGIPTQKVLTTPGMSPAGAWDSAMLPLRLPEAPAHPMWSMPAPTSPPVAPRPPSLMPSFHPQMLLMHPRLALAAAQLQQQHQHQAVQAAALHRHAAFQKMQMTAAAANPAAAAAHMAQQMGLKRSWEQAFPPGAAMSQVKRPTYPQTTFQAPPPPQAAGPVMYQQGPQFYPSM